MQPGTVLYELADLSTVWVLADVYEYEIDRVRTGREATITFAAYPDRGFPGKITFLYPTIDPGTRTLRVRIELPNKDLALRPGMYGDVRIRSDATEGIFVPFEAVVDTGEAKYLFLAQAKGRFEPRRVKLGARAGDKVQILDGIADGDEVVTTANFLLDSESRLRATIQGGGGAPGAAPAPSPECDGKFDRQKYPDKHQQCLACQVHRGMGTMEQDCQNAIPKPWK